MAKKSFTTMILSALITIGSASKATAVPAVAGGSDWDYFNHEVPASVTFTANGLPILHSNPSAKAQVYLDFDGDMSRIGDDGEAVKAIDFDGDPSTFNAFEQQYIYNWWVCTSSIFSMFDIDVTTEIDTNDARIWNLISPSWNGGAAGFNSFGMTEGTSVISQGFGPYSTVIGHEGGHGLALPHAINWNEFGELTEGYYGCPDPLRAAIMGSADNIQNKWYNKNHWAYDTVIFDDISTVIQTIQNYVPESQGFRVDEHAGNTASATELTVDGNFLRGAGIIERMNDVDMFSFGWGGGRISIQTNAFEVSPVCLKTSLLDSSGALVALVDNGINHQFLQAELPAGQYYLKLESAGRFSDLGEYRVTVNSLPDNWFVKNVGPVRIIKDNYYDSANDQWILNCSGNDIWGSEDRMIYAYQKLSGNGEIIARVQDLENLDSWTKGGVMIRENLNGNAKEFSALISPDNGTLCHFRNSSGGTTVNVNGSYGPQWLKVSRVGDLLAASHSSDGTSWTVISTQNISMTNDVYIGLAYCSHNFQVAGKATFGQVSVTGDVTPTIYNQGVLAAVDLSVDSMTSESVTTSWNAIAGAESYIVERSKDNVNFEEIAILTSTTYTDSDLTDGRQYFYRVQTVDNNGDYSTSSVKSARTRSGKVNDLRFISLKTDTIVLDWEEPFGETAFRVERSTDGVNYSVVETTEADRRKFVDAGLATATKYFYKVITIDEFGDSDVALISGYTRLPETFGLTVESTSTSEVNLVWSDIVGESSYQIERSVDGGDNWSVIGNNVADTTSYTDTTVTSFTAYLYRVIGYNGSSKSESAEVLTTITPSNGLNSPWKSNNVNINDTSANSEQAQDNFNVKVSAADIWGTSDSFHYIYQNFFGDGEIVAQVTSQTETSGWAKAGVMLRETLDAGSKNVFAFLTPKNGVASQVRTYSDNGTSSTNITGMVAPCWVKLVRSGNLFTSFYSTDGSSWVKMESRTVDMQASIYVGLATTSNNSTEIGEVSFAGVTVSDDANSAVEVPTVIGLNQAVAEAQLIADGLVVGSINSLFSDNIAAGIVISQSLTSGTLVYQNSSIDLIVSAGPKPVVISLNFTDGGPGLGYSEASELAGVVESGYWETAAGNSPLNDSNLADLRDNSGDATSVSFDWSGNAGASYGTPSNYNTSTALYNNKMLENWTDTNSATLTFSGMDNFASTYDVYIYSASPHNRTGSFTVDGVTKWISTNPFNGPFAESTATDVATAQAERGTASYVKFSNVTLATLAIAVSSTESWITVNGIQIVDTTPKMTIVPNVVGLAQATAEANLVSAQLTVGAVTTAYDLTIPAGDVISQSVTAGSSVVLNTTVDLVVSLGPEMTTVPNVVGLTQTTAEANLVSAQLTVGAVTTAYDLTIPAGDVISQSVTAGSSVVLNTTVDLVVSLGPEMTTVPNVVGLTQTTAEANLVSAQLTVGAVTTAYDLTIPAGDVISQSVTAGNSVVLNTTVDLVVSLGPKPTVISINFTDGGPGMGNSIASEIAGVVESGYWETVVGNTALNDSSTSSLRNSLGVSTSVAFDWSGNIGSSWGSSTGFNTATALYNNQMLENWTDTNSATLTFAGLDEFASTYDVYIYSVSPHNRTGSFTVDGVTKWISTNPSTGPFAESNAADATTAQAERGTASYVKFSNVSLATLAISVASTESWITVNGIQIVKTAEPTPKTTVPNVTGLDQATAEANLISAQLIVGTISQLNDDVVAAGDVISQSVTAGSSVVLNTTVDLVVSLGPEMTTVPNVVGLTQTTAEANLVSAQLTVGSVTTAYDLTIPAGDVISQSVTAGNSVILNTTVDLVVSLGPEMTTVPNVVGLVQATAEANLASAQLVVGTISQLNDEVVPAGNVISQSVTAGDSVVLNTTVDLVISLGSSIPMPKLYSTVVTAVGTDEWVRVTTPDTYSSMVVVATPRIVDATNVSMVTRITNVSSNSFDLIIQRIDDGSGIFTAVDVDVMVAEEGVYTAAECGVDMEVGKHNSSITTYRNNYNIDQIVPVNSYTTPVVLGQVMSFNDSQWSVFWSCNGNRANVPDASGIYIGKAVGEDGNTVRNDETLGYIIIESGVSTVNGVTFECGIGADTVKGFDDAPGYTYTLSGSLSSASSAILSATAFDGADQGTPVLYGLTPVTSGSLELVFAEDTKNDSERKHTTEQVAYIVFE